MRHFTVTIGRRVPPIRVGKRKLWDLRALDRYLDEQSEVAEPKLRPVEDYINRLGTTMKPVIIILLLLAAPALAADKSVRSRPNSQGGETYYYSGSKHPIQCRPNSQGGQTCHAI